MLSLMADDQLLYTFRLQVSCPGRGTTRSRNKAPGRPTLAEALRHRVTIFDSTALPTSAHSAEPRRCAMSSIRRSGPCQTQTSAQASKTDQRHARPTHSRFAADALQAHRSAAAFSKAPCRKATKLRRSTSCSTARQLSAARVCASGPSSPAHSKGPEGGGASITWQR